VEEVMYKTSSKFIQYGLEFVRGLKKNDKVEEELKRLEALNKRKEHYIRIKRKGRKRR
jgi:hypothetical protein